MKQPARRQVPWSAPPRGPTLDVMLASHGFQERAGRAGLEFQARFFQAVLGRFPENAEALAELGHALTRLERYEEGLAVDRQLVGLVPENETAHYNLACSLALCGHEQQALDSLEEAVRLGYGDVHHLLADEALRSLRTEPRFRAIAETLQG